MKRLPPIFACLLFGAVINIAVAWACALWAPTPWDTNAPVTTRAGGTWSAPMPPSFPPPSRVESRSCVWLSVIDASVEFEGGGLAAQRAAHFGIPCRSAKFVFVPEFVLSSTESHHQDLSFDRFTLHGGVIAPRWVAPKKGRPIPLIPLWPGFLINTVIYATTLFALSLVPTTLLRTLRRRRGLCPRCAYDLRALPAASPCPECGRHAPKEAA